MTQLMTYLYNTSLSEMTGWHLLLFVLVSTALVFVAYKVLKGVWAGFKKIFVAIGKACSAKEKCKKIKCRKCGRTLDACICAKYKNKSCRKRLKIWKKEQRILKKKRALAEKLAADSSTESTA